MAKPLKMSSLSLDAGNSERSGIRTPEGTLEVPAPPSPTPPSESETVIATLTEVLPAAPAKGATL